jgi:hypothetical protein
MFRQFLFAAALGGGMMLGACGGGTGAGGTVNDQVTMISDTVEFMTALRAAPSGTTNWSQNLLGNQHLMPLDSKQVTIARPEGQCVYDFAFDTSHHQTFYVRGQDLCQHNAVHLRTGR